jgi:AbrB family looped-hinge helix DNA binding protein
MIVTDVATMSTKGQVVVPMAVRERLKLLPGALLRFTVDAGRILVEIVEKPETHDPVAHRAKIDAFWADMAANYDAPNVFADIEGEDFVFEEE